MACPTFIRCWGPFGLAQLLEEVRLGGTPRPTIKSEVLPYFLGRGGRRWNAVPTFRSRRSATLPWFRAGGGYSVPLFAAQSHHEKPYPPMSKSHLRSSSPQEREGLYPIPPPNASLKSRLSSCNLRTQSTRRNISEAPLQTVGVPKCVRGQPPSWRRQSRQEFPMGGRTALATPAGDCRGAASCQA